MILSPLHGLGGGSSNDPNDSGAGEGWREVVSGSPGGGEERYRRLFLTAQEGIVLASPAGEILDCNPALCRITGYEREELIGTQASTLYDRDSRRELVRALQDTGQIEGLKLPLRRKDGEELLCLVSALLWTDADGNPTAVQSFVRDVTEEARAREALAESEEKFRSLAENAPVGIGLLRDGSSEEWTLTYVNPAFAQILGYAPNEIIGRSPKELAHPEDWPAVRAWIQSRLTGEGKARLQARAVTKSDEARHVEVFGGRTTYHETPALVGGIVDVTEQRQLQRQILEVQEKERRSVGRDLHDGVAAQLTGISLILGTALEMLGEDDPARRHIQRAKKLIQETGQDVRQLSRGLSPTALSEEGLLGALGRLAENAEGCFLEIDEDVDDSLLSPEEKTQLYWIAQEAVANARRHAEADEIEIRLSKEDDTLIFAVEDDGEGFEIARMEQKGEQAPGEGDLESQGLGLRSMRHRAELLGADFSVDTGPGEGTCVTCRLPSLGR